MARTLKILVQTMTPRQADDWSIDSLSLMRKELASIVTEPVGDTLKKDPHAASDILRYVRNLALWLAPEP